MTTKPYKSNETIEPGKVSEPSISYGMTQDTCSPCQYTAEELRQRVYLAIEQSKQGLGLSQEEMRLRKPVWR